MIHNALSFVAVVKAGSFSAAARNIGISKAQLSRNLSQLEQELGIKLLYRTTRSITLTESGEEFFLNCQDIAESWQLAVDKLKEDFHTLKGTLRITAPVTFGSEFLPELLYRFNLKYPHIKIILSLSSITEDLVEKNFDLSIRIATSLPDSSLRIHTLMSLDTVLCAAPSYLENKKMPRALKDLEQHKCIGTLNRNNNATRTSWSFHQDGDLVKFSPDLIFEADSIRAQINLAVCGAGIAKIPHIFIKNEIAEGKLVQLLPELKQPELFVYLLFPNRKNLPGKLRVFIDFMREVVE